jgi:hypothetical protein
MALVRETINGMTLDTVLPLLFVYFMLGVIKDSVCSSNGVCSYALL